MVKPSGAKTVQEYLDQIDEPRKSEIQALHGIISRAAPNLEPAIHSGMIGYGSFHYKYESGREGDWPVIALASNKNYISIHVCGAAHAGYYPEQHKRDFPKANIGKGCIRFKRLADIDIHRLTAMVKAGQQAAGSNAI